MFGYRSRRRSNSHDCRRVREVQWRTVRCKTTLERQETIPAGPQELGCSKVGDNSTECFSKERLEKHDEVLKDQERAGILKKKFQKMR